MGQFSLLYWAVSGTVFIAILGSEWDSFHCYIGQRVGQFSLLYWAASGTVFIVILGCEWDSFHC